MSPQQPQLWLWSWLYIIILIVLVSTSWNSVVEAQGPYYPNHWYGANQANIRTGKVPLRREWPEPRYGKGLYSSTLAPHLCGFNPFIRKCMDPDNLCPGRCMNFQYTFNSRYDCRCLVI